MEESYISVGADNKPKAFVGRDGVEVFRVRMLISSIRLHMRSGIIPTRGVTITKMFAMAGEYTGKKYKRGQHEQAMADLKIWLDTMVTALPIIQED